MKIQKILFKGILGSIGLGLFVLVLLIAAEIYLRWSDFLTKDRLADRITSCYRPFYKQYLHPFYYFFFPQDAKTIAQINNAIVSINAQGFRDPGPDKKKNRKLAFILGGSAAFGDKCSGNEKTISGYLNMLQNEYHFVNAGVPSWNSTQEFYRLSLELVHYKPSLIIVYDGFNDAMISWNYAVNYRDYLPGTVESYNYLEKYVKDIREDKLFRMNISKIKGTFTLRYASYFFKKIIKTRNPITRESIDYLSTDLKEKARQGADAYLKNLELMQRIAKGYNEKIIFILQPVHAPFFKDASRGLFIKYFYDYAIANGRAVGLIDFGNLFDEKRDHAESENIFLDSVHTNDRGNELIANEIWNILAHRNVYRHNQ